MAAVSLRSSLVILAVPALVAVGLAGCVDDDASLYAEDGRPVRGVLHCLDRDSIAAPPEPGRPDDTHACNLWATVDPWERQANELTVAVNPIDPHNIIASGKDYTPSQAGDCVRDGVYVTHDGGATWSNANVPGSPWRLLQDPTSFEPHPQLSAFYCVTDPVVAFGPDGTAYWTIMPYQCDPVTGSKFGREFVPGTGLGHPSGGFNDHFWSCSSMYVLVSEDGGATWPIVREVAFGPRLEHDKQWLSVAPDGRVLLCWDRAPDWQIGGLYPDGTPEEGQQALDPFVQAILGGGRMTCSVSADQGRSWAEPVDVNPDTWGGLLPWVDWGPDGTAWMAALDGAFFGGGDVIVSRSSDGLSWAEPVVIGQYQNPPAGGEYGWPVLEGSDFRMFALPSLAVDRSDGPHSGNLYVVWFTHPLDADGNPTDGEVVVSVSRDDGATWTEAVRVHDDPVDSGFDQFMPAVSVGPDGTVDVVWYDRRDDPQNHLFDLYYTYSIDGGRTWSHDLRVSEVSSDEQFSLHQNGMVFLGDYIDIDSYEGHAVPVWVDTRHGKADAFIAVIERPGAR